MTFTLDDVLQIVGLLLVGGGAFLAMYRHTDRKVGGAHGRIDEINRRVDELARQAVAREDLNEHLARVEKLFAEGFRALREELARTHARIDALMQRLSEERRP